MIGRPDFSAGKLITQRVLRGLLILLLAWLGYSSVTHGAAYVVQHYDIALAHKLAPSEGRITGELALELFTQAKSPKQQAAASELARLALRQDPTVVPAVVTLGLAAEMRGDAAQANRIFRFSQRLSRRDLYTQLWAVEDSVRKGSIDGAMLHYDIAMRTSERAPEIIFPVLSSAIGSPAIRSSLIATLAKKPAWSWLFIRYVADNGIDSQSTLSLFEGLMKAGVSIPPAASVGLIARLVADKYFDAAWRFYASIRPRVDRRRSRVLQSDEANAAPTNFDWTVNKIEGLSASILHGPRGNAFVFSLPPTAGGTLLTQAQVLPPGDYRFEGHSSGIDQPESALPIWTLSCADGRELGRIVVQKSDQANGKFEGRFRVPATCPFQTLSLGAQPTDSIADLSGQIDRIRLFPVVIDQP